MAIPGDVATQFFVWTPSGSSLRAFQLSEHFAETDVVWLEVGSFPPTDAATWPRLQGRVDFLGKLMSYTFENFARAAAPARRALPCR